MIVVDSWVFVPDAGTMVVIVTGCTDALVEVISGRPLWVAVVVATALGVEREGDKVVVVKKMLRVVNISEGN